MRSQFCQLTSVLFASLSLVAMAVGLLAFASTALASDPLDPTPVPLRCDGCPPNGTNGACNGVGFGKCKSIGNAYCVKNGAATPCFNCKCERDLTTGDCECK